MTSLFDVPGPIGFHRWWPLVVVGVLIALFLAAGSEGNETADPAEAETLPPAKNIGEIHDRLDDAEIQQPGPSWILVAVVLAGLAAVARRE